MLAMVLAVAVIDPGFGTTLAADDAPHAARAALGRDLFFDPNLSRGRNQSCATCHDPARGFTDPREPALGASRGSDQRALGTRNTPSLSYVGLTPDFHTDRDGEPRGGFFLDGRATSLAEQALGPILNPIEMALPDAQALLARLRENPHYVERITALYGSSVWRGTDAVMSALGSAIAAFENGTEFAGFDSKYDRFLRGEYALTPQEEMGRSLFFSPMTNCAECHVLHSGELHRSEPFSNYRYHNIGIPGNPRLLAAGDHGPGFRDAGLYQHPAVDDESARGKFKVPSLRNVAVTAPYMHNGVFQELRTAIVFYNRYTIHTQASEINPETNAPWGPAEYPDTIDFEILSRGQPIDNGRADALIAFLKTLTDARFEPLLEPRND